MKLANTTYTYARVPKKKRVVSFRVTECEHAILVAMAKRQGVTVDKLVADAVRAHTVGVGE
jgi:predicted HicB family RNase H-like nuclease